MMLVLFVTVPVLHAQAPPAPLIPVPVIPEKPAVPPGAAVPPSPAKPAPAKPVTPVVPSPPPAASADLAPEHPAFVRPKVPVPLFTHQKTALLEVECERIAAFLARHAAEKYTAAVLRHDREATAEGRLLLTISLHLAPGNGGAVHCADC
jgi:hypothetical protein